MRRFMAVLLLLAMAIGAIYACGGGGSSTPVVGDGGGGTTTGTVRLTGSANQ